MLYHRVRAVERVFRMLEKENRRFQRLSGLACPPGCGLCCTKPGIEATPLEFLPLAYRLYTQDLAEVVYDSLRDPVPDLCIFYQPDSTDGALGRCGQYPLRGLICRLFRVSATVNRRGILEPAACKVIKARFADCFEAKARDIREGRLRPPVGHLYHLRMAAIDSALAVEFLPINQAIKRSLAIVLGYYSYRRKRKRAG